MMVGEAHPATAVGTVGEAPGAQKPVVDLTGVFDGWFHYKYYYYYYYYYYYHYYFNNMNNSSCNCN